MSDACVTYSVRDLSRMLGVSMSTLYREVRSGNIEHIKVGSRILVPHEAVKSLLEQVRR